MQWLKLDGFRRADCTPKWNRTIVRSATERSACREDFFDVADQVQLYVMLRYVENVDVATKRGAINTEQRKYVVEILYF